MGFEPTLSRYDGDVLAVNTKEAWCRWRESNPQFRLLLGTNVVFPIKLHPHGAPRGNRTLDSGFGSLCSLH